MTPGCISSYIYVSHRPISNRLDNDTGPSFEKTEYQKSEGGMFYEFWVHCIILILIPWVSVLAMNLQIIQKVSCVH